jgi:hypothetical protein
MITRMLLRAGTMTHPYNASVQAYGKATEAFDYFATNALASTPETLKRIPSASALEQANSFLVARTSPASLQAWLGKRPTGRPTTDSKRMDVENGAHLVYSLGATGIAAAILYPARSDGAAVKEKYMVLGFWKPEHLAEQIEGHLQLLVAYQYVTSIDGQPTFSERLKVRWLRLVCLREINGQQSVATKVFLDYLAGMATRGLFAAVFRIVLFVVLVLSLIWFGYGGLAALLAKRV